jgi:hypothetical protein
MNAQLDIKNTEKASFKLANYADGTVDIGLGLVMILLGFNPLTRQSLGVTLNFILFLVGLGIIVGLQTLLKSRVAPSRVGVVRFGQRVLNRKKAAIIVTAVLVVLTGLTWYASARGIPLPHPVLFGRYGLDLVFAALILAVFWILGYTLGVYRYYPYGVLLAVAFLDPLPSSLVGWDLQLSLALAGVVILLVGVFLLLRFLRVYPAAGPDAEEEA